MKGRFIKDRTRACVSAVECRRVFTDDLRLFMSLMSLFFSFLLPFVMNNIFVFFVLQRGGSAAYGAMGGQIPVCL